MIGRRTRRCLPPRRDPYVIDREIGVPDVTAHRRNYNSPPTWRRLRDGRPVASFRSRKGSPSAYDMHIQRFAPLYDDDLLQAECDAVATLRRCDRAEVTVE